MPFVEPFTDQNGDGVLERPRLVRALVRADGMASVVRRPMDVTVFVPEVLEFCLQVPGVRCDQLFSIEQSKGYETIEFSQPASHLDRFAGIEDDCGGR